MKPSSFPSIRATDCNGAELAAKTPALAVDALAEGAANRRAAADVPSSPVSEKSRVAGSPAPDFAVTLTEIPVPGRRLDPSASVDPSGLLIVNVYRELRSESEMNPEETPQDSAEAEAAKARRNAFLAQFRPGFMSIYVLFNNSTRHARHQALRFEALGPSMYLLNRFIQL